MVEPIFDLVFIFFKRVARSWGDLSIGRVWRSKELIRLGADPEAEIH